VYRVARGLQDVVTNFTRRAWVNSALGVAGLVVAVVATLKSDELAGVVAAVALVMVVVVTVYALWVRERFGGIYEIVSSELEWDLTSADGSSATNTKKNRVRFIQNNVLAIPDYIWGDGTTSSDYSCKPGNQVAAFFEGSKKCVVIALDRMYNRDDELDIEIKRTVRNAFLGADEWVEVKPLAGTPALSFTVLWPAGRPPRTVTLTIDNERRNKRKITQLNDDNGLGWHEGDRRKFYRHFARPSSDERIRIDWVWEDPQNATATTTPAQSG
jgi:hypothetical protein